MSDIISPPFSGDYSFNIFAERKRYLGMLQQQGKRVLDVNLNDNAQLVFANLMRTVQSAFPSQFYGEAFKVVETQTGATDSFALLARRNATDPAASLTDPESYARGWVRGIQAQLTNADGNGGRPFTVAGAAPIVGQENFELAEIHHRVTNSPGANTIEDVNAKYVVNDLIGRNCAIIDNDGVVQNLAITANTETTISFGSAPASPVGSFYRVDPSAPAGDRADLVWLDVYIGEYGANEDENLLNPIGAGDETTRRLTVLQHIRYTENVIGFATPTPVDLDTLLPYGAVYQQTTGSTGLIHYAVPIALIRRPTGTTSIIAAYIEDLRDPNFGSSREIVEARDGFDTLFAKIDSIDPEIDERFSAQPTTQIYAVAGWEARYQTVGDDAYVGVTAVEDVSDVARLYDATGRVPLRTTQPNIVSDHIQGGSADYQTPGGTFAWEVGLADGTTVNGSFAIAAISDPAALDQVIAALQANATFSAYVLADKASGGSRLVLRGTALLAEKGSYIRLLSAGGVMFDWFSAALIAKYSDGASGLRVDTARTPRVLFIGSDPAVTVDVRGAGNGPTTSFQTDAYFLFDGQVFGGDVTMRYGAAVSFKTEPESAPIDRDVIESDVPFDRRLEVEHFPDGTHKRDVIKSSMLDWGVGADQIDASDLPYTPAGANPLSAGASSAALAITELSETYVDRAGGALSAMLGAFQMGNNKIELLADPTLPQDGATKAYVDSVAVGLLVAESVKAASTTNIGSLSGPATIDTISLVATDRVLLKNQSNKIENGIWIVQAGAWTRPAGSLPVGWNSTLTQTSGVAVFVEDDPLDAAVNENTTWVQTLPGNPVVDTNNTDWTQFTATGDLIGGDALLKTGSTLDVRVDTTQGLIDIVADKLTLDMALLTGSAGTSVIADATGKTLIVGSGAAGQGLTGGGIGATGGDGTLSIDPASFMAAANFAVTGSVGTKSVALAADGVQVEHILGGIGTGSIHASKIPATADVGEGIAATNIQGWLEEVAAERLSTVDTAAQTVAGQVIFPANGVLVGGTGITDAQFYAFNNNLHLFAHETASGDVGQGRIFTKVKIPSPDRGQLRVNVVGDYDGGVHFVKAGITGGAHGETLGVSGRMRAYDADGDFELNTGGSLRIHTHATGQGGQITGAGIANGAVDTLQLATGAVSPAKMVRGSRNSFVRVSEVTIATTGPDVVHDISILDTNNAATHLGTATTFPPGLYLVQYSFGIKSVLSTPEFMTFVVGNEGTGINDPMYAALAFDSIENWVEALDDDDARWGTASVILLTTTSGIILIGRISVKANETQNVIINIANLRIIPVMTGG